MQVQFLFEATLADDASMEDEVHIGQTLASVLMDNMSKPVRLVAVSRQRTYWRNDWTREAGYASE